MTQRDGTRTPDPEAIWTTREPGTYLLLLRLDRPTRIAVGRLGEIDFPGGCYVYVGSALSGLGHRLARHARLEKRHHWHIDHLRAITVLEAVAARRGRERLECIIASGLAARDGGRLAVARFGASDCRCPGHLLFFDRPPALALDDAWIVATPPTAATSPTATAP